MKLVKKCGIGAVITAALFLTAALVIGCMGPYDGPSFQEAYKPPAGKGAVRLNFNSSSGRTILPVAMALTDFYDFELDFEADPMGSGDDDTVDITRASLTGGKSAHFPLEPGDYRLVVTAFLGTGSRGNPAAVWTSGDPGDYDVTITAGQNKEVTVALKPFAIGTAGETGTLTWTITNAGDLKEVDVSLEILLISSMAKQGATETHGFTTANAATPWTGTRASLATAYYYVDLELDLDPASAGTKTREYRRVAHIYRNLTSPFPFSFAYDSTTGSVDISMAANMYDVTPVELTGNLEETEVDFSLGAAAGTQHTLAFASASDYATYKWWYGTTDITGDAVTTSLALNNAAGPFQYAPFNEKGTYRITIVGIDSDGVPSSTWVDIKVVD